MADDRLKGLLDKFDEIKEEVEKLFGDLGFGKDQVGRAHDAVDVARAAVASSGIHGGHDLNDDLAAIEPELVPEPAADPAPPVAQAPETYASAPAVETPAAPVEPAQK